MGERTGIEWCDHTFNQSEATRGMTQPVAVAAERHAVCYIKSAFWICSKRLDVVSVEIAATRVSAVLAGKPVSCIDVISPALQFLRVAQTKTLMASAINIARRCGAAGCSLARRFADLGARVCRVRLSAAVAWARLGSRAHLGTALLRHFHPLHRRHESRATFQPSFSDDFATAQRGIGHG